jgi:hypothetical protein
MEFAIKTVLIRNVDLILRTVEVDATSTALIAT